jgi:hypothetical protein
VPERGLEVEGWYKDKNCEIPHGEVAWYHPNKVLKSKGTYVNGKQEGVWLTFGEEAGMRDLVTYAAGKRKGVGLHWNVDGMMVDLTQFDGAGNGVEVSWFPDGAVSSAGLWVSDTTKKGRGKYYHPNGQLKASEDYAGGERTSWACFDEGGTPLDTAAGPEQEASFPGGINAWMKFVQNNLKADVPVRLKAPLGQYTVVMQFIVGTDARIEGIKPLTRFGYGMEEEVERMLKKAPRWMPAQQFKTKVKAIANNPSLL